MTPSPALAQGSAAPSVFSAYVGEAMPQPGAEPPQPCSALCRPEQDGTCKFQPKQAVAFVKDVANITIVSTGQMRVRVHLPGGQWARQGSLSGQHATWVRVTVAMRAVWQKVGEEEPGLAAGCSGSDLGVHRVLLSGIPFLVHQLSAVTPSCLCERV